MDPTQQPIQTPPEVFTSQPKLNYLKIILFSILGVLLVTSIIYLYLQNQKLQKQVLNPQISPTIQAPSPTSTSTSTPKKTSSISISPDETASWKTYTNSKFGYSFKLPINSALRVLEEPFTTSVDEPVEVQNGETPPTPPLFYVSTIPDQSMLKSELPYNYLSPEQLTKLLSLKVGEEKAINDEVEWNVFKRLPNIMVNNISGMVFENSKVWEFSGKDRRIVFKNNGFTFIIATYYKTQTGLDLFDQILSTFKLTN